MTSYNSPKAHDRASSHQQYFHWRADTRIVYGAKRAAAYDLKSGNVYSLDESARQVVERLVSTQPVLTMPVPWQQFLAQMVELELGYYEDTPQESRPDGNDVAPPAALNFLWLELTGACNLRCQHCYVEAGPHLKVTEPVRSRRNMDEIPLLDASHIQHSVAKAEGVLTKEDWLRVIQQAAAQGCRQIQFIGGEPLLYKHLLELIDAAIAYEYTHIEIFTNGTLLTEEIIQAFAARGVRIAVSLHGASPKTQDCISQKEGSFEQILRGLELLQKYGVKTRLATTAMKLNQYELAAVEELAKHYGIDYMSYDVVRSTGRGQDLELLPTERTLYESKWLLKPVFMTSRESFARNKRWHTCWSGRLAVTNSGDVIPCVFGREQAMGNVRENGLAEILAGERLHTLWGLTKDQVEVCRDCEYRYACGDCRPAAMGGSGNLYAKYPRCSYNPYEGEWKSLDEALGLVGAIDKCADSAPYFKGREEYLGRFPNSAKAIIPVVILVTDHTISAQNRYKVYTCDPQ